MSAFTTGLGWELPPLGFGTYKLNGARGADAIRTAIDMGYRLIDTAYNYENEGTVGKAITQTDVPRDKLIVTSKLPGRYQAYDLARQTIEESLYRLGLDTIDLYLIHWPLPRLDLYVEAWTALIDAKRQGLVTHIGVCNFLPEHLERLESETGVLPEVNQVELHPYFPQLDALEYNHAKGIVVEAWSPLGRGNSLLSEPTITQIAQAHAVTPGQTVLAWHRQIGALALPKATSASHQKQNLASLTVTLTADEVAAISALGRPDGRTKGQDPATWEEF